MSDKEMQDMLRMQEDAKRRVMDMHSRSRYAAEQMNRSLRPGAAEIKPAPAPEAHSPPAREGVAEMDREELERLFLLSLCLLLSQEGADQSVILGLMYLLT